jgi:hypothetical protein
MKILITQFSSASYYFLCFRFQQKLFLKKFCKHILPYAILDLLAICYRHFNNYIIFLSHLVDMATSSPADIPHYINPPKLLLTNRFYFWQTSGIHAQVGKRKVCSLSGRSPAHMADSFNVATMARKHSVLNLREINRNNKHTALASVWTYYEWASLIF